MVFGSDATGTPPRLNATRAAWACGAALVCSTVLFYFATGLSPVAGPAWLAPLPVLVLAPYVSTRWALGTAFGSYVLSTIPSWSFYAGSSDTPLWPVGVLIIVSFAGTLVLAVWTFRRLLVRGRILLATFAAPAVWTAVLYLISVSNPMGIMGTLATTQADVPAVAKVASVTGWTGLEFLVFFVPTAIAALVAPGLATVVRVRAGVAGTLVVVLALGIAPLLSGGDRGDKNTRQVAVIARSASSWGVEVSAPEGQRLLDSYASEIVRLPDGVDTVVLPEGVFTVDDRSVHTLTDRLARAARAHGTTVVVGYNRKSSGKKFDTAHVLPADGAEPVTYLKQHDRVSQLGSTLTHQPGTSNRVGVQICLDINFADPSREYGRAGTGLMLVPGADNGRNGWQHSRTAMLRGIENGFAVAWADMNGHSVIADSRGRVLADAPTHGPAEFTTLVAAVPDGPGGSVYAHYGDWFAWLTILLGFGGLAASWFAPRTTGVTASSNATGVVEKRRVPS